MGVLPKLAACQPSPAAQPAVLLRGTTRAGSLDERAQQKQTDRLSVQSSPASSTERLRCPDVKVFHEEQGNELTQLTGQIVEVGQRRAVLPRLWGRPLRRGILFVQPRHLALAHQLRQIDLFLLVCAQRNEASFGDIQGTCRRHS